MPEDKLLQAIREIVKSEVQGVREDIQEVKEDLQGVKEDLQEVKEDLQGVKQDVSELKERVASLELTLENETNRNIKIIAEGHLDISRKLDDALKVENEKEMLLIRVNILENELRKIKRQLGA